MTIEPHDLPSNVTAIDGEVIMEGPAGIVVSFTPAAAIATSDRLFQSAIHARGQLVMAKRKSGIHDPDES